MSYAWLNCFSSTPCDPHSTPQPSPTPTAATYTSSPRANTPSSFSTNAPAKQVYGTEATNMLPRLPVRAMTHGATKLPGTTAMYTVMRQ